MRNPIAVRAATPNPARHHNSLSPAIIVNCRKCLKNKTKTNISLHWKQLNAWSDGREVTFKETLHFSKIKNDYRISTI